MQNNADIRGIVQDRGIFRGTFSYNLHENCKSCMVVNYANLRLKLYSLRRGYFMFSFP